MDKELMADALSKLRLKDIYLNESKILRDSDYTDESNQDGVYQQEFLQVEADELIPDDDSFPNLLRCIVTIGARFVREATAAPDTDVVELAKIEASFCVLYEKHGEIEPDCIQEFMQFNVVHNAWSFWRQHAFSMARSAKLPIPEVPLRKPIKKDD